MNDARLSNARTTLSNSILNLSHLFKLPNYNEEEMLLLSKNILCKNNILSEDKFIIAMKCFQNSKEYIKSYSDNGITLREIKKLYKFSKKCPDVPLNILLELIICPQIPLMKVEKFKKENNLTQTIEETPKIENGYLCFSKLIQFKLYKNTYDGLINKQYTNLQKEALMKIIIGILSKKAILLSGEIGSGKTFIIESLAEIVGIKLNVIQFNTETSSSDIIGRLEMNVDSETTQKLKDLLIQLKEQLIKEKWEKITEYLILIKDDSFDSFKIINFLEINLNNIPKDLKNLSEKCINELKDFSNKACTSFEFKKSLLIKAIEDGEWILFDDVQFAPHEIERLMSLLEENPTLTIYENTSHDIYSKKNINENFRLFIITSDDSVISYAIKSRCLCVRIQSFNKPEHYAELISGCLSNSNIRESLIIDIAKYVGNAFYNLKIEEKQSNYILKNYLLTSVNLVNIIKILISSGNINGKNLSESIKFAIFSMFKDDNISENFINYLQLTPKFNIYPITTIKKHYEYYLGIFELKIISYVYEKRLNNNNNETNIIEQINNELNTITIRNTKIEKIQKEDKNKIIDFIKSKRMYLYENIELFSLMEINEYQLNINEVLEILEKFINKDDEMFGIFYYLKYLSWIFSELLEIKIEKIYGIKIKTMTHNKEFFNNYEVDENKSFDYANKLFFFRNFLSGFHFLIPEYIPLIDLNMSIISFYMIYFSEKYENEKLENIHISKKIYIHYKMLEIIELREILKQLTLKY